MTNTHTQLYHNYADQAGYYDVCLLIYHAADHRNIPDIRNTWSNLIDQVHPGSGAYPEPDPSTTPSDEHEHELTTFERDLT